MNEWMALLVTSYTLFFRFLNLFVVDEDIFVLSALEQDSRDLVFYLK